MPVSAKQLFEFGEFRIDLAQRVLRRRDGSRVSLTPRVFDTLCYFVEHPAQVLDKEMLMEAVWPDCIVEENNLAQNISTLRRVFGDSRGHHRYIATVPGRGYRFVAEVNAVEETNAPQPELSALEPARPRVEVVPEIARPPARARSIAFALAAVVLALAALLWWRTPARVPASAAPERSIAVLPFANLSGDPENAYFADGVKDEILTRLARIAALKVISRTSTEPFKKAPHNLREIAAQLGVANILEGSVQKSGSTVRVTVQLIHAGSDTHLWAETYDRELTDLFAVETEVAQRIATSLATTLTGSEQTALQSKPTVNVEAHQACLRGRYFWNKRSVEGYRTAITHFRQAIEKDPAYAHAYAGLADAYLYLGGDDSADEADAIAQGRAALQRALELDETLAEAHASLGLLAMNFDWDWAEAEREFKRALELNPNYATAHQWNGEFLVSMGRAEEGVAELRKALELDPLSVVISTDLGKVLLLARRYDEASAQFHRALEMDPDFAVAQGLLALTLSLQGKHEDALTQIRQIKNIAGNPMHLAWLGYIYGAAGRKGEAENTLQELEALAQKTYVSPTWPLLLAIGLGDKEYAFAQLERVVHEHSIGGAIPLRVNPLFDPLRSDPRYAEFLRRASLAE